MPVHPEAHGAVGKASSTPTHEPLVPTASPVAGLAAALCGPTDVKTKYSDSGERYQILTVSIVLTNASAAPCLLQFFPQAHLLDATGKPLEIAYYFFKDPEPAAHSNVLVEPRQPVGFLIVWKNWCTHPLTGGVRIQISLPEATLPIDVSTAGTALEKTTIYTEVGCTHPGKPSEVWISQLLYNAPVPLYP